jgi:hypothetical protein
MWAAMSKKIQTIAICFLVVYISPSKTYTFV